MGLTSEHVGAIVEALRRPIAPSADFDGTPSGSGVYRREMNAYQALLRARIPHPQGISGSELLWVRLDARIPLLSQILCFASATLGHFKDA